MALNPLCKLHYLAAAAAMIALLAMCQASTPDELIMAEKHEKWMSEFDRSYKDETEKATRFKVFRENAAYIEAFNQQAAGAKKTFTLGLNKFSDLTNQEFLARHTGYVSGRRSTMKSSSSFKYAEAADPPESIDWRRNGSFTLVEDQGSCGCCWAFTAIAAVEGYYHIKTGKLISFSVQELLDCDIDNKFHNGCDGADPDIAFQYIIGNNGNITTEPDYPYQGLKGDTCRSAAFESFYAYIGDIMQVPGNNESALMEAVAQQPVAAAIDPNGPNFQSY